MHQHRFDLVVTRVAGCHAIRALALGREREELVAHRARCLFDPLAVRARDTRDVALAGDALKPELRCQTTHELKVVPRIRSKLVVEMRDRDAKAKFVRQPEQDMQAGEGIRSAGDGDEDVLDPPEHALTQGSFPDLLDYRFKRAVSGGIAAPTRPRTLRCRLRARGW